MSAKGFVLPQDGHLVDLIKPVSAGAAQVGTRFSLAMWAHASIVVRFGAAGGPIGAATLKVYPALTGGSGVAIPYKYFIQNAASAPLDVFGGLNQATATGYTPGADTAGGDISIEIDAADLLIAANGAYVELNIAVGSLGTTAQLIDAFAILSGGRSASDQSPSVQV